jgi:hypothetical protein
LETTEREVVLKDAPRKTIRIPVPEVDERVPEGRSLMHESLLRDMTAQQAADLSEFQARQR